jgi:hypothetical protein
MNVADPPVQHVLVELGPELGAVVGLDHLDLERQLLEYVVQEPDGALLVQPVVDPKDPDPDGLAELIDIEEDQSAGRPCSSCVWR